MLQKSKIICLTIGCTRNSSRGIHRCKPNTSLRLYPNVGVLGSEVILYTNYPADKDAVFERGRRRSLHPWLLNGKEFLPSNQGPVPLLVTRSDVYVELKLTRPGIYRFWLLDAKRELEIDELHVQIEPELRVGCGESERIIPLEAICCQTVHSKLLGPLSTWEPRLRVSKESGYNMLHFTPIQELGASCSAFNLKNQLRVNPNFASEGEPPVSFENVVEVVDQCRKTWGIASICDIVLNHTANESEWLLEYPEATYSCATCPHLRPAFLFDVLLAQCSRDICNGCLEEIPPVITTHEHVNILKEKILPHYLHKINLHEFYQCNVDKIVDDFLHIRNDSLACNYSPEESMELEMKLRDQIKLIPDLLYRRLGATINLQKCFSIINSNSRDISMSPKNTENNLAMKKDSEILRQHLEYLNACIQDEINNYLKEALRNVTMQVLYDFVVGDELRVLESRKRNQVFVRYFTDNNIAEIYSLQEVEELMYSDEGRYFMAHNGWIICGQANPLVDFAAPQPHFGNVYLKRELYIWDDSVKLRYGDGPEDNEYLWQHMTTYVETTAGIFDGVRIDNCHSTPAHVAEYLLDKARRVNPNLYVVAELFTNSREKDIEYMKRVGINALIREAFSAYDPHDLGRMIFQYGGEAVSSFQPHDFKQRGEHEIPAMFMDWTHDNPSPLVKRTINDVLPNAALVALSHCAVGSNRGYDELVPHQIDLVKEARLYQEWGRHLSLESGIIAAKRELNALHVKLAEEGFTQIFVDRVESDVITVTRNSYLTHERVILIARTAFKDSPNTETDDSPVKPLQFKGELKEILMEAKLEPSSLSDFQSKPIFINGDQQSKLFIRKQIALEQSRFLEMETGAETGDKTRALTKLHFKNFKPGSIVIIRVALGEAAEKSLQNIQSFLNSFENRQTTPTNNPQMNRLLGVISKLKLVDLNYVLFVCQSEEKEFSTMDLETGVYNVPGYGDLIYAGLQGIMTVTTKISANNDLGHPLCNNLRKGNWLMDYITDRLKRLSSTSDLGDFLDKECFESLKRLPRYLIPSYFEAILRTVHQLLLEHAHTRMKSKFIRNDGDEFIKSLAVASLQFVAIRPKACLPEASPFLQTPRPEYSVTVAAGLPHFSTGYMRCWGRDTFISLRGLLLLTGRYDEARHLILAFGQTLRHGLIPNLLYGECSDAKFNVRFNARDAVWWWLYSITRFVEEAPNGHRILYDQVSRLYPMDHSEQQESGACDQDLIEVMLEAIQVHFEGLSFRERDAGLSIDAHMRDLGFDIDIGVDPETGFVFGGNQWNCGTWMDKMGSSDKAANRGYPTTPRNGSAVELVGLQYAVLRFMQKAFEEGNSVHESVTKTESGKSITWTFKSWADRIQANFECFFFLDENSKIVDEKGNQIKKRNIYKDCHGSSRVSNDFQLRCNFPIAMVASPELFDDQRAWSALEIVRKNLLGRLGIKTLDPDDEDYCDFYDQSNDSNDPKVAHGANYHQGPEWLWPLGYYLRARLYFAKRLGYLDDTIKETWTILRQHALELQSSDWHGLPELTNGNGVYCKHSCPTQAWSIAAILEVIYDLQFVYNSKIAHGICTN